MDAVTNNLNKIYPNINQDFNFGLICIIEDIIESLGVEISIEKDHIKIINKNNKITYSPEYILKHAEEKYSLDEL